MTLEMKRFQEADYPEYAAWFADPELNRQLGPMGADWLDAILSEPESEGVTWAVFRDSELVAVVETVFDPQGQWPAAISGVAVKPALRRQGLGVAVLQHVLALHNSRGINEHIAYVAADNLAGRRCLEKVGFLVTAPQPNEHGYLEFRRLA